MPSKAAKPRKKPRADPAWVAATIPAHAAVTTRFATHTALAELVARAVHWVDIAASLRARSCSSCRLRLYEPKASGRSKRVTGKTRLAYLRDPVNGKAADYADDARDLSEIIDHPVLDLLRRPNKWRLGYEHQFMLWYDLYITGNAFEQTHPQETPGGLYRLAPHRTRIVTSPTEFVKAYVYGERGADEETFEAEEIDHYRFRPSPFSPVLGIGCLQQILIDVDRYSASTLQDLNMWKNSGRPEGMIKLPEGSTDKQVEAIRAEWAKRYQGVRNSHQTLVATGIEYTPFSWAPKDLEGVASREDARTIILAAFGVPESMAKLNDANLASSWTGNIQFRRETVWPDLIQRATALTEYLLPRFGVAPGEMWFCFDNPVPDDEKALLEKNRTMVSMAGKTINEWRAEDGMDPSEEPLADKLLFQGIPLESMASMGVGSISAAEGVTMEPRLSGETQNGDEPAALPAGVKPPVTGGAVVQDTALNGAQIQALIDLVQSIAQGQVPVEAGRAIAAAAFPLVPPQQVDDIFSSLDGFEPKVDPIELAAAEARQLPPGNSDGKPKPKPEEKSATVEAKTDTALILSHEHSSCCTTKEKGDFPPVPLETAFERDLRRFMLAAQAAFFDQPDAAERGIPVAEWERIFRETVEEPILATFGAGFDRGAAMVEAAREGSATAVRFDVASERAQEALAAYEIRLRESVIRTMTDRLVAAAVSPIDDPAFVAPVELNQALRAAVQQGESLSGAIGRVREEFENLSGYGAERIARTETQRAYGAGKVAAWRDIPGVTAKRWLLSGSPCAMCVDLHARRAVVPLEQPFARVGETFGGVLITYADVHTNTLHPNDSCGMTFVFEEEMAP